MKDLVRIMKIQNNNDGTSTLDLDFDSELYQNLVDIAREKGISFNDLFVEALKTYMNNKNA